MADRLSDDEVKNIIDKVMPGYRVVQTNAAQEEVMASDADALEINAEAVAPGLDAMKASIRRADNLADDSNPAERALADILQNFSSASRDRASASTGEPIKRDRIVSLEPAEGRRDLSDVKSRVKSVLISGETGDIDVRQG